MEAAGHAWQSRLAVAYVDARAVEDRLDHVFGVDGWQDAYHLLPNGNVVCKLRVKIGTEWIEKSDVGGQSDQPDESDRTKSAFSDALKRAAVKLGIGRYLYRLPQQWVNFDPNTRQITQTPQLPEWAQAKEEPKQPAKSAKPAGKISPGAMGRNQGEPDRKERRRSQVPRSLQDPEAARSLGTAIRGALELSVNPPNEWIHQRDVAA